MIATGRNAQAVAKEKFDLIMIGDSITHNFEKPEYQARVAPVLCPAAGAEPRLLRRPAPRTFSGTSQQRRSSTASRPKSSP